MREALSRMTEMRQAKSLTILLKIHHASHSLLKDRIGELSDIIPKSTNLRNGLPELCSIVEVEHLMRERVWVSVEA